MSPTFPYALTQVEPISMHELRVQRAVVASLLPHLQWRQHGLGVLQAYLTEHEEPEIRVHIWHPALATFTPQEAGRIHNHRFTLRSCVLHGAIGHEEVQVRRDPNGTWSQHEVIHARNQKPEDMPAACEGHYSATFIEGSVSQGNVYTFPKRAFHRSSVKDLAVTIVTKIDQDETPARLLTPRDHKPAHGINHPRAADVVTFVRRAVQALSMPLPDAPSGA